MVLVYYINFGPHGPRAQRRKDGWEILGGVATCVAISFTIFWLIRQYRTPLNLLSCSLLTLWAVTPPPPRTMTREWQEATNRRFRELGIEPITGPGSEDYKVRPQYNNNVNGCRAKAWCTAISSTGKVVKFLVTRTNRTENIGKVLMFLRRAGVDKVGR